MHLPLLSRVKEQAIRKFTRLSEERVPKRDTPPGVMCQLSAAGAIEFIDPLIAVTA